MNLTFSLNNNQTFTILTEKKEEFSLLLNQVARAQEEQTIDTDLILNVPELGTFNISSENQPTLFQWLNENAVVSLFGSEVIRPLYETSLDFNTNTFQ